MNREQIIRMAREAGFVPPDGIFATWDASDEDLERFAALVAEKAKAEERKACAKVCEDKNTLLAWATYAQAIRARGQA